MFWANTKPVPEASTDLGVMAAEEYWPIRTSERSSAGITGFAGGAVDVVVVDVVVVDVVDVGVVDVVVVDEVVVES